MDIVTIELLGQEFTLISAGPQFRFNPSISFLVACETKNEVDTLWKVLSEGGMALMDLGEYPFSERYGWVQGRYGLSWQVMFTGGHKIKQKITPTLLFVGKQCGKAEEAINFYATVFHNAKVGDIDRYNKAEEPDKDGTIKHAAFALEGLEFAAMDSARVHNLTFNEAISFMVHCETQEEIDYYWGQLSADPKAEQCGWLRINTASHGRSFPTVMDEMLKDKDKERLARVTEAFLKMKKFDIEALKKAYKGGNWRVARGYGSDGKRRGYCNLLRVIGFSMMALLSNLHLRIDVKIFGIYLDKCKKNWRCRSWMTVHFAACGGLLPRTYRKCKIRSERLILNDILRRLLVRCP